MCALSLYSIGKTSWSGRKLFKSLVGIKIANVELTETMCISLRNEKEWTGGGGVGRGSRAFQMQRML